MPRNMLTQVEFAKMSNAFTSTKEAIEKDLATKTLQEMAADRKISVSTFKSLCAVAGIDCRKHGLGPKTKVAPLLIQDILTVIVRIGAAVDDKCPELQQYLQPTK